MNNVSLIGRIVYNPEIRTTGAGKKFVKFRVAIDNGKGPNGDSLTLFLDCTYFSKSEKDKTPDNMVKYCGKGAVIGVFGRLTSRTYIRKSDQIEVTAIEVLAGSVTFVMKTPTELADTGAPKQEPNPVDVADDELPF